MWVGECLLIIWPIFDNFRDHVTIVIVGKVFSVFSSLTILEIYPLFVTAHSRQLTTFRPFNTVYFYPSNSIWCIYLLSYTVILLALWFNNFCYNIFWQIYENSSICPENTNDRPKIKFMLISVGLLQYSHATFCPRSAKFSIIGLKSHKFFSTENNCRYCSQISSLA